MLKKVAILGMAVVMLFSLAACNPSSDLIQYRADAKATIQKYADTKIQFFSDPLGSEIYTDESLAAINVIVTNGKRVVDLAKDESDIDDAVFLAQIEIDAVKRKIAGLGRFDGLDPEIELQIIKTYYGEDYVWQEYINYNPIGVYYGTYNNCVVMYCYGWSWGGWQFGVFDEEVIENIKFVYPHGGVKLWSSGKFYSLREAYDKEFLSIDNLEQIAVRMKEKHPGFYMDVV